MVATMHRMLFVFVVCCLTLTTGQTCTRPSSRPSIPAGLTPVMKFPTFSAEVEIYKKEVKSLIAMKLFYDQTQNMIRLSYLQNTLRRDDYYYFSDNEILSFTYPPDSPRGKCEVDTNLSKSKKTSIVGGTICDSQGKNCKIPPVLNVFRFTGTDADGNEIFPKYVGKNQIRDKDVYEFSSCQKWQYVEETMFTFQATVTHYFTQYKDTAAWKYPYTFAMPVSMHVVGKSGDTVIDQTWNFFNIKTLIPPFSPETPPGIACPNRKIDMPFPQLPSFLKMDLEVIDHSLGSIHYTSEIYDDDGNYAVLRQSQISGPGKQLTPAKINYVQNFGSGLSYRIDAETQECAIQNITDVLMPFYYTINGKAVEYDPKRFFLAYNAQYTYLGERKVRGILCSTWVANVNNLPFGNATVEWYFARKDVKTWNDKSREKDFRIPVRCRVWINHGPIPDFNLPNNYYDYNVHHVDYTKLLINEVSIKPCLTSSPSNLFKITFPDVVQKMMISNVQELEWKLLLDIANAANVHWLRVSDFKIYFKDNDALATFELLDAPPYSGNAQRPIKEPSLKEATDSLTKAISSGKIGITGSASGSDKSVTIAASTKASVHGSQVWKFGSNDNSDSNYTGGAMAGLGIVMLAIGLASGGGGSYYLIYKKGAFV